MKNTFIDVRRFVLRLRLRATVLLYCLTTFVFYSSLLPLVLILLILFFFPFFSSNSRMCESGGALSACVRMCVTIGIGAETGKVRVVMLLLLETSSEKMLER